MVTKLNQQFGIELVIVIGARALRRRECMAKIIILMGVFLSLLILQEHYSTQNLAHEQAPKQQLSQLKF